MKTVLCREVSAKGSCPLISADHHPAPLILLYIPALLASPGDEPLATHPQSKVGERWVDSSCEGWPICEGNRRQKWHSKTDLKNVELDLGLLCVSDNNTINQKKWKEDKDAYMMSEAHKAVKLILGKLAEPPKKFKTKWEEYADKKGIKKHKKEKKIYDEETKIPTRTSSTRRKQIRKRGWPRMSTRGYRTLPEPRRLKLKMAVIKARVATASMGRFDPVMREEKNLPAKTAKRKLPADFGSVEKENDKMLEIFKNIQKKRPKLDNDRAANLQIQETMDENRQKSGNKKKKPNLTNISRHQKFGKHAKNHKKMGGKKAKAAAKHTF
ncbi:RRS1 [Cordylochernes scorpioides]|uniref:Ribosome biogenesis regulatory protein n=1 Tax=Cordylochernes scorpioides TaxID=51811 RepID=A0ABY6L4R5_9ARAC|nr:RRS1 [Cordylochernes scorpioides]